MGIVSRVGRWLDKHFPEKMSVEEVETKITRMADYLVSMDKALMELKARLVVLEKSNAQLETVSELKDDMNKIKAIMQMKATQRVNMPDLTGAVPWKR